MPGAIDCSFRALPVIALLLAGLPTHARSDRLNLHLEPTGARFLGAPQSELFGWGVGAAARAEVRLVGPLSVQLGLGWLEFFSQTAGLENGRALWAGAGLRARLFGDLGPLRAAWLDAQANLVGTGPRVRFGYEVGAGADFSLGSSFALGPFVRFAHVVQPAVPDEDPSSALMLQFGLSLSLGFFAPVTDPAEAARPPNPLPPPSPPPPLVSPPPPEPPPEPPQVITRDSLQITRAIDTDGDGIPDSRDGCPKEPETLNGVDDDDGCPDPERGAALVVVGKTRIEVRPWLRFDAAGKPDVASQAVLATVARVLLLHPELRRVRVETREPSKQRAAAVRQHLEASGLEGRFGPEAEAEAGPARTRSVRVELVILDRG